MIFKTCSFPSCTLFSRLQLLIKDHKPTGNVVCRPVHATPSFIFGGLSSWLISVLRAKLSERAPHLLRDTSDVVGRLHDPRPDSSWHFSKVDVTDFYVNGNVDEITSCVLSLFDTRDVIYSTLEAVIRFLLQCQFVRDPWGDSEDLVYQVVFGSGMGLPHSGELANCAFLGLVERRLLHPRILNEHGIRGHFRFRDDILLLGQGLASRTRIYLDMMRTLATFYSLTAEWGRSSIEYLEVSICIGCGRFDV